MDAQLHVLTQSNTSAPRIQEGDLTVPSSPTLSPLLLQEMKTIEEDILAKLEFLHKAKLLWHSRTINCLAKKDCPPLQSAIERQYIVLEVRRRDIFVKSI
jgi:hypothetical protein